MRSSMIPEKLSKLFGIRWFLFLAVMVINCLVPMVMPSMREMSSIFICFGPNIPDKFTVVSVILTLRRMLLSVRR